MTYTLAGRTFATKTLVAEHASIVLHRSHVGVALEGDDDAFARALLGNHPEAPRKHGVGIDFVYVAEIPAWRTRNFLIYCNDHTVDNWSIKKCVANLRADCSSTA